MIVRFLKWCGVSYGGKVHPTVQPPPPPERPVWEGNCNCCGAKIIANHVPDTPGLCLLCATGISDAMRQRNKYRKQIDLIKQALREFYEEQKDSNGYD